MVNEVKIEILVDESLYDHYLKNLEKEKSEDRPEEGIRRLIQLILDGSEYPLAAKLTKEGKIVVSYHVRSFSQPLF